MPVYKGSSQAKAQTNYGGQPSRATGQKAPSYGRSKRVGRYRPPQRTLRPLPSSPKTFGPQVGRVVKTFGKRAIRTAPGVIRIASPLGRVVRLVRLWQYNEDRRLRQMAQDGAHPYGQGLTHYAPGYRLNCGSPNPGRVGAWFACSSVGNVGTGCGGCTNFPTTRPSTYGTHSEPIGRYGPNPDFGKYVRLGQWERVAGSSTPSATYPAPRNVGVPGVQGIPGVGWVPSVEPYGSPRALAPPETAVPRGVLPYVNTNPWGMPEGVVSGQPGVYPGALPDSGTFDVNRPDLLPPPAAHPVPNPSTLPRPPGAGVKERKVRVRAAYTVVSRLMNGFTETYDAVDAIWYAMPKQSRRAAWEYYGRSERGLTYSQKAEWIYKHAKSLDARKAALNLLTNQVEDAVIGKGSKAAGDFLGGPSNFGGTRFGGLGVGP